MTDEQTKLIHSLMAGSIDSDQFRKDFPADLSKRGTFISESLRDAIHDRDEDSVDRALFVGFSFQLFDDRLIPLLSELLRFKWHHDHENIASIFQTLHHPSTVEVLFEAAQTRHDYLAYNDSASFANKCLWALATIGTNESRQKINDILLTDDRTDVRATAAHLLSDPPT